MRLCLYQHLLDSIHLYHILWFLFGSDPSWLVALHKLLMCNRSCWAYPLVCLQTLLQGKYFCLLLFSLYNYFMFPLLGITFPFHLRMICSMFLGILDVFSVAHNWVAFQFFVLILSWLHGWEVVLSALFSVRVSYILVWMFEIWFCLQLVHLCFGLFEWVASLLCLFWIWYVWL